MTRPAPDVSNPERRPVILASDLDTLDDDEMTEGYCDGIAAFPCGANRSRSYWHGWRNGMVDGGHAKKDIYQDMLAADKAQRERYRRMMSHARP